MTPHFTYAEAVKTNSGLVNIPSPQIAVNIGVTAMRMERVREILNSRPININSWFRSEAVNKAVGGSKTSAHMKGYAVDFTCRHFGSEYEVAKAIDAATALQFDQLILEYGWVHISFAPKMRAQLLTKKSASAPYEIGLIK